MVNEKIVPAETSCGQTASDLRDTGWLRERTARGELRGPRILTTGAGLFPPDGLPFWASAGPDGDFRTGDDNVYSFES